MLRGEDLETRPRGEHISAAEEELLELRSKISGRWVDAGDLREGDVLLLGGPGNSGPGGSGAREAAISRVTLFEETQPTYNFAVDDLHNYAVGNCGVLVHNSCSSDSRELRKNLGLKTGSGYDAHHLVASNHPRAASGRDILRDYGVLKNGSANGIGLLRKKHRTAGLHTHAAIDRVNDRLRIAVRGLDPNIVADFNLGQQRVLDALNRLKRQIRKGNFP